MSRQREQDHDGARASPTQATAAPWPFEKIDRHLSSARRARRCVLLTTGALNPVHRGHVAMFDRARASLESNFDLEVVGGFLSPSHDLYLRGKYQGRSSFFFPAAQRIEMCLAATKEHPLLAVGSWESSVPNRWPDFPEVTRALVHALNDRFPGEALLVLYLCGEDHFKYAERAALPGVCVVSRAGRSATLDPARNHFCVPDAADDASSQTSSTRVRNALASGDMELLRSDVHPDVVKLLLNPR